MEQRGILSALLEAFGADIVLAGERAALRSTADWSGAPACSPLAVVMPRTNLDVAAALRICNSFGARVAVQGGLTGLAGGANPTEGEVVLSLSRLDKIEDFDEIGGTVVVQAGMTLEKLQQAVAERGWFFPLDLGARGSCQLGGNAATNAGGNRVVRFGMMRDLVLGLEVALPDGTLLNMLDRVVKNNAGFDLKQLFIGSEGCLGVITRLSLELEPDPGSDCTVICGVENFDAAARLLRDARRTLPGLSAFELMWADFMRASAKAQNLPPLFEREYPLYVLIEILTADRASALDALERLLAQGMDEGLVADAILAQSQAQSRTLWSYREGISELLSLLKPSAAFDVSVAMPRMSTLVNDLRAALSRSSAGVQHLFFGHLGDGNLHLLSGPYPDEKELLAVEEIVYRQVSAAGGSISAEHGIGVVKRPFLSFSRSEAEIGLMRKLKAAIDPMGILNAGRVFELEPR